MQQKTKDHTRVEKRRPQIPIIFLAPLPLLYYCDQYSAPGQHRVAYIVVFLTGSAFFCKRPIDVSFIFHNFLSHYTLTLAVIIAPPPPAFSSASLLASSQIWWR